MDKTDKINRTNSTDRLDRLQNAKWIFFDMGYTLVDEYGEHYRRAEIAIKRASERGVRITLDEFMQRAYKYGAEGHSPIGRACESIGEGYIPYTAEGERAYPAAAEVLSCLSKKYKLGIIANQLPGAWERLRRFGLADNISVIMASADCGMEKPAPEIFLAALDAAGCTANEAIMVGDRADNDIKPAHDIGMMTVRIHQGFFADYTPLGDGYVADLELADVAELPGALGV